MKLEQVLASKTFADAENGNQLIEVSRQGEDGYTLLIWDEKDKTVPVVAESGMANLTEVYATLYTETYIENELNWH